MQAFEHLLFVRGKLRRHAMEKQRGFVEKTFGRLNALDDDAFGDLAKLHLFFRGKLLPGENNNR